MQADDDTNSYKTTANLDLSSLKVAVLTENMSSFGMDAARREAFTVALAGVKAEMQQMPNRRRNVNFQIADAQVVLQDHDVVHCGGYPNPPHHPPKWTCSE